MGLAKGSVPSARGYHVKRRIAIQERSKPAPAMGLAKGSFSSARGYHAKTPIAVK